LISRLVWQCWRGVGTATTWISKTLWKVFWFFFHVFCYCCQPFGDFMTSRTNRRAYSQAHLSDRWREIPRLQAKDEPDCAELADE